MPCYCFTVVIFRSIFAYLRSMPIVFKRQRNFVFIGSIRQRRHEEVHEARRPLEEGRPSRRDDRVRLPGRCARLLPSLHEADAANGHAAELPRRDPHAHAEDAHPSAHHQLPNLRYALLPKDNWRGWAQWRQSIGKLPLPKENSRFGRFGCRIKNSIVICCPEKA